MAHPASPAGSPQVPAGSFPGAPPACSKVGPQVTTPGTRVTHEVTPVPRPRLFQQVFQKLGGGGRGRWPGGGDRGNFARRRSWVCRVDQRCPDPARPGPLALSLPSLDLALAAGNRGLQGGTGRGETLFPRRSAGGHAPKEGGEGGRAADKGSDRSPRGPHAAPRYTHLGWAGGVRGAQSPLPAGRAGAQVCRARGPSARTGGGGGGQRRL